jgi:hypothetical protein
MVEECRLLGCGACGFIMNGHFSSLALFLLPWRWRRHFPPKRRLIINPHGATYQKTAFFTVTAVKTSNPTRLWSFGIWGRAILYMNTMFKRHRTSTRYLHHRHRRVICRGKNGVDIRKKGIRSLKEYRYMLWLGSPVWNSPFPGPWQLTFSVQITTALAGPNFFILISPFLFLPASLSLNPFLLFYIYPILFPL